MIAGAEPHSAAKASDRAAQDRSGQPYRLAIMALLGLALVTAGGASRGDEIQQLFVRLAAIAAIAASLWPLDFDRFRSHSGWLLAVAAAYALVLIQLLPLPPALWAQLPGHQAYARIAVEADAVGWRPLSLTPDLTLNALFGLLPATAAAIAAIHLNAHGRRRLSRWMVAAAALSGLLGLVQLGAGGNALHLFRESSDNSAVGLFANRNHQAAFLACALPLTGAIAGLRLRDGASTWVMIGAALLTLLLLVALVATGSRMGLILGALGLAGAAWSFQVGSRQTLRLSRRAFAGAVLGALIFVGAIAFAAVRIGLVERLIASEAAAETRAQMLAPLIRTAQAFMPWGSGFGSFDSVYRQFEPDSLLSTIHMNQAHNEPVQLAIEGGVAALALLGLFLWWWAGAAIRILRADLPSARRAMAISAVAISFILLMSSLVDYPLRTPLLGAVFAIACVEMARALVAARRRVTRYSSCPGGRS